MSLTEETRRREFAAPSSGMQMDPCSQDSDDGTAWQALAAAAFPGETSRPRWKHGYGHLSGKRGEGRRSFYHQKQEAWMQALVTEIEHYLCVADSPGGND